MHCLPAVSYSDSLSVSLRWQSYYGAGFFKWTFTTASTLPRGTVASLSGYFLFRSACLYVTGFTRCWVNSYFWRISLQICLLQGDRWYRELRSHVTSRQVIIFILVPNTARPVRYHQIKNELVFAFARHGRKPPARRWRQTWPWFSPSVDNPYTGYDSAISCVLPHRYHLNGDSTDSFKLLCAQPSTFLICKISKKQKASPSA